MLNKIKKLFKWRPAELSEVKTPQNQDATFLLTHHDVEIGVLSLHQGVWTFEYTEDYKKQEHLKPLVNFPDKNKTYTYQQLPPFFASRLPGLGQPVVRHFLEKEGIDEADEVTMLKKFGKRTIANPYVLELAY